MGCSALNSDLFRKNIVNSPHCTCGAIETPTHYLLNSRHYNIPRQEEDSKTVLSEVKNNVHIKWFEL
jgi:hypothetical protein